MVASTGRKVPDLEMLNTGKFESNYNDRNYCTIKKNSDRSILGSLVQLQ